MKSNTSFALVAALAGLALAAVPSLAQPKKDFAADIVVTGDGRTLSTMKLYVSGLKVRNETNMMGNMVSIVRRDKKLVWILYPQRKVYMEKPLDPRYQSGEIGLDLPGVISKERVGREQVMGYACTKYKLTIQSPAAGRQTTAYVWWADALGLGLKSEIMGMVSEFRSVRFGPQPDHLFELPPGYQKTDTPVLNPGGGPTGLSPETMRKLQEAMKKRDSRN